jgi:hypothetical protein
MYVLIGLFSIFWVTILILSKLDRLISAVNRCDDELESLNKSWLKKSEKST